MLPGFRFLVAAVVLCLSLLVFGFGAIALLRSAREEFASLPVRRAAPQAAFTQQAAEAPPTLSMLRIETPEIATPAPNDAPVAIPQEILSPAAAPAPEPERLASLSLGPPAAEIAVAEPARPEPAPVATVAPIEPPAPVVAALPVAATEPQADEPTTVAAIASPAAPEQPASTLTEADAQIVMMNVATLGGPSVDIEPAPLPKSKPVVTVKKKARVVKEKPVKRRRVTARAEAPRAQAAAAPAPAQSDPFGWQQPQR